RRVQGGGAGLTRAASGADAAAISLKEAETGLEELRTRAAGAAGLDESKRLLEVARDAERVEAERPAELERGASEAEAEAAAMVRELDAQASHKAAAQQAELERARWRDRHEDLQRQLAGLEEDLAPPHHAAEERAKRVAAANESAALAAEVLPRLRAEAEGAKAR